MSEKAETVEELLARIWKESAPKGSKPWEPPRQILPSLSSPSKLAQPGTRVRVVGQDPDWVYACAGHPAIGSEGLISEVLSPEGKTSVSFHERLNLTDGSFYSIGDEDPITFYLPDRVLEIVGV